MSVSLLAAAQECRDRLANGDDFGPAEIDRLEGLAVAVDDRLCRTVADRFDAAHVLEWTGAIERGYDALERDIRVQYGALTDAGVKVEPWLGRAQPYRNAAELVGRVRATGTLQVFLTRNGHGPPGAGTSHPLRRLAGVTVRGVPLSVNDLFRAVHDVFGHVLFGHEFGLGGELKAAYCQMALSSPEARPVIFAEQVAQTCWFFLGPYARDPGYVPPHRRPYPEQKVFPVPLQALEQFAGMFTLEEVA